VRGRFSIDALGDTRVIVRQCWDRTRVLLRQVCRLCKALDVGRIVVGVRPFGVEGTRGRLTKVAGNAHFPSRSLMVSFGMNEKQLRGIDD
jgi:hypothetical protein